MERRDPNAWYNVDPDCKPGGFERLKYLFENVTKLRSAEQRKLVDYCLLKRNESVMRLMLNSSIDLSLTFTRLDMTILHLIVQAFDFRFLKLLSFKNFDVNARNSQGFTALLLAVEKKGVDTVELLLDIGADPNIGNKSGELPLLCASNRETPIETTKTIIALLLQYGADVERVVAHTWICNVIDRLPTVFDHLTLTVYSMFLEPVLSHLALLRSTGRPIKATTINRINSYSTVRDQFDCCMQQLERMTAMNVSESRTLYDFLTASDKQVLLHAMNDEFKSKFDSVLEEIQGQFNSYFLDTMTRRMAKANTKIRGMNNIAFIISEITGLLVDKYHNAVDKISGYLNYKDFLCLEQV